MSNTNSVVVPQGETIVCEHCQGKGECYCPKCMPPFDVEDYSRGSLDPTDPNEGTCSFCNGLGKTDKDGTPLV